jgi:hypothetical protein
MTHVSHYFSLSKILSFVILCTEVNSVQKTLWPILQNFADLKLFKSMHIRNQKFSNRKEKEN